MEFQLTAVYHAVREGYVGFVEELPGANTQGATLDETRSNLREAVELVIEANRALADEDLPKTEIILEPRRATNGKRERLRRLRLSRLGSNTRGQL